MHPTVSGSTDFMHEEQQTAVVRGLQAGDPQAWQSLYDAYSQRVWGAVARLMGADLASVADVVQETFLAAARSARGYDAEKGSLWLWLCGIIRNQIAMHYRKQARQARIWKEAPHSISRNGQLGRWLESGGPKPDADLETAETAALVRAVLEELTDDYGTLLTARYLDGTSVDEIAGLEKSSTTAVRSKLARARRAFRETFERLTTGSGLNETGENDER